MTQPPITQPPGTQPATTPAPTQPSTTPPPPVGPDGKIAFTRQNQIYTINPDGTGELKLTTADKNYIPRWSPDGQRIAYVHEVGGVRNIWVMNATGSNKQQVTFDGSSAGADWSPDGQWLVYAGRLQAGEVVVKRIRSETPFGTSEQFIPLNDSVEGVFGTPDWSSAGDIVFRASGAGTNATYLESYDVATGAFWRVANYDPSDGSLLNKPRFSSDGSVLTWTVADSNNDGVNEPPVVRMVRMSDGQAVSSWTSVPHDEDLVFAPSGTRVALMNDATGTPTIFIANPNGTNRDPLTTGYEPDWQRLP